MMNLRAIIYLTGAIICLTFLLLAVGMMSYASMSDAPISEPKVNIYCKVGRINYIEKDVLPANVYITSFNGTYSILFKNGFKIIVPTDKCMIWYTNDQL